MLLESSDVLAQFSRRLATTLLAEVFFVLLLLFPSLFRSVLTAKKIAAVRTDVERLEKKKRQDKNNSLLAG